MTPRRTGQRPGLPALTARIGTYADFMETMRARLVAHRPLDPLTVRSTDDPSIALLDCWAVIADTVTFYGERALNEGYLGTATEPTSVDRITRLVGYRPRPALGSSGHLAFTMDPGQSGSVPAGTPAKSVSGGDLPPQTFETSESLEARSEWNQLAVRMTRPFAISPKTVDDLEELTFVGSSLNLKAGDLLVFDFGMVDQPGLRELASVTADFEANRTVVTLVPVPGHPLGVERVMRAVDRLARAAAKDTSTAFRAALSPALLAAADQLDERVDLVLPALATLLRLVVESQGLVERGRLLPGDSDWVAAELDPLADAVRAATPLAGADTRGRDPQLAYLDRLARAITCPDENGGEGGGGGEIAAARGDPLDCSAGGPLLATAAALAALRRPPARAHEAGGASPQPLATALAPRSEGLRELLAGSDERLGVALSTATATLPVAGPQLTARVIALRTRTHPVRDAPIGEVQVSVDGMPENLVAGGWIVSREVNVHDAQLPALQSQLVTRITQVEHLVRTVSLADGTTKVGVPTSVAVTLGPVLPSHGHVNVDHVTLWFGDQPLVLADQPIPDPVGGGEIALAQPYPGLEPGRLLVVSGERSDVPGVSGVTGAEVVVVGAVEQRVDLALPGDVARPVLVLATPLAYEYVRTSALVQGNVAAATQGETRSEVLGSGVTSQAGQSFALKQPTATAPLTHLASASVAGARTTLDVRVDGVRWHPSDLLADDGPRDHAYAVDEGPGAAVTIRFGDGIHGARIPNGVENVTATYRVGAGSSGNLAPDVVRQLISRPLGVTAVTNPVPMTGGTRADTGADARVVGPLRTLALDRLVSVADYEDFAVAHAGIAKASATRLHDAGREVLHLTVAAVDDAPLDPSDLLMTSLERSLAAYGDPTLPVVVDVRRRIRLVLQAGVKIDPDYLFDDVAGRVRARLVDQLGFRGSVLGDAVPLSRVVATIQSTAGVSYVDVDAFGGLSEAADPVRLLTEVTALSGVAGRVVARAARSVHEVYVVGNDPTGAPDTLSSIALRHGLSLAELLELNPRLRTVVLSDGDTMVVAGGIAAAELACFDPDQPQTLVLRSIP